MKQKCSVYSMNHIYLKQNMKQKPIPSNPDSVCPAQQKD